jgi:hypothetical protein
MLWSLGRRGSLWSDRFQLGGPTNIRAFRANSMGPRDGGEWHIFCIGLNGNWRIWCSGFIGRRYVLECRVELNLEYPTQRTLASEDACVDQRGQIGYHGSVYVLI